MPKISALGTISQLTTSSILPVVDNNETQKVTLKRIVEFVSASIDVTFATEIELLQSASSITSSLNAFASASILSVNSKLSTSSFEAYTASVSSANTSSLLTTSSFNTYTSSNNTTNTTQNNRLTSLENSSGSYLLKTETGSFVLTSSLPVVTPFLSSSTFNTYTSSLSGVISGSSQITNLGFAPTSSLAVITPFLSSSTFNSYTSSNDSKWNTLGGQTGSYILSSQTSSFVTEAETGSFLTSLPNGLISGSGRIVELGFATTSSVLNIDTSSLVTTSSFNTYTASISTASLVSRLNQIESVSGSWITESETGSFALTANLPVVTPFLSSSTFNTFSASINTFTSSANTSLNNVYTATSSLNTFTSSINTTIKSKLNTDGVISGSSQISGLGYATTSSVANVDTSSLLLTSSFNTYTASLLGAISSSIQITNLGFATTSSLAVVTPFLSSSVFNTFATSSNTFTASVNTTTASLNTFSSSVNTFTSSANTALSNVYTATASLNTFTSSYGTTSASFDSRINSIVNGSGFATTSSFNTFTASVNTFSSSINTYTASINSTTASLNGKTGSYATTGSNQFKDNQTITGSLIVTALTTISSSISANSSSLYLSSGSNLFVQNNGLVEITGSVTLSGSMTIQSGSITMPNRPAFRVSGSASTDRGVNTILSGSAVSVDYNEGGYFNTTNGKFTAPIAGLYHVYFNGRVGSTNSPMQVIVYKNTNISTLMWESQTNTGASHFGVSGILKLAVNDTLEAKVTVGSIQFDGNDSWGATYIG